MMRRGICQSNDGCRIDVALHCRAPLFGIADQIGIARQDRCGVLGQRTCAIRCEKQRRTDGCSDVRRGGDYGLTHRGGQHIQILRVSRKPAFNDHCPICTCHRQTFGCHQR